MRAERISRRGLPLLLAVGLAACASPEMPNTYDYFAAPDAADPWSVPIAIWQERQRREAPVEEVAGAELARRYRAFVSERRRRTAGEIAAWAREVCGGCGDADGIAVEALQSLGFPEHEVWRAVLRHDGRDAELPVALWFEDPEDPWVVGGGKAMRRLSELEGWRPVRVFSRAVEFAGTGRAVTD